MEPLENDHVMPPAMLEFDLAPTAVPPDSHPSTVSFTDTYCNRCPSPIVPPGTYAHGPEGMPCMGGTPPLSTAYHHNSSPDSLNSEPAMIPSQSRRDNLICGFGEKTDANTAPVVDSASRVAAGAPTLEAVYAIADGSMHVQQLQQDERLNALARRSGREKKLSAKATQAALIAQHVAEERERKRQEVKTADAAAQLEAVRNAAAILWETHEWGDGGPKVLALRKKVEDLTEQPADHAYKHERTSMEGACSEERKHSRASSEPAGTSRRVGEDSWRLNFLADIALSGLDIDADEGICNASADVIKQTVNQHNRSLRREKMNRRRSCSHTEGPRQKSAERFLSHNLAWGARRQRSDCTKRRPRENLSALLIGISFRPTGTIHDYVGLACRARDTSTSCMLR
jgi:hypothetical protein